MDSILKSQPGICYICDREVQTERHHCLMGSYRQISERLGLVVYLCPEHHRGTYGVHGRDGAELNRYLQRQAQYAFEKDHTREEWMQEVGRNYL